jgi:hypothetical protein
VREPEGARGAGKSTSSGRGWPGGTGLIRKGTRRRGGPGHAAQPRRSRAGSEQAVEVLDETPIARAIRYAQNQRAALTRFLIDGRLIDEEARAEGSAGASCAVRLTESDRAGQGDASAPRREGEGVLMYAEAEQRRGAPRIRRPVTGDSVRRSKVSYPPRAGTRPALLATRPSADSNQVIGDGLVEGS